MQCLEARNRIRAGGTQAADLQAHLGTCALCRQYQADRMLEDVLNSLAIPEPDADFAERSIARAIASRPTVAGNSRPFGQRRLASVLSLAAVLLLGVFIGVWLNDGFTPDTDPGMIAESVPEAAPYQLPETASGPVATTGTAAVAATAQALIGLQVNRVKPVNVVIDSSTELDEATIQISLADNIEIDGYPDTRELRWKTRLLKGKNLLTLPLVMRDDRDGYLDVAYQAGERNYRVRIAINASPETAPAPAPSI